MRNIIGVLLNDFQRGHLLAVDGLTAYRDQHHLDWDIRLVNTAMAQQIPESTYWVTMGTIDASLLPQNRHQKQTISLTGTNCSQVITCCTLDQKAFGTLAAHHLYEQGFRHFGVVHSKTNSRALQRLGGFQQAALNYGIQVHHLHCNGYDKDGLDQTLISSLTALPRPLGIYSFIDAQADWLRNQFLNAQLRIPDDVALVGTGDIQRACYARAPFLSTVPFPWGLMGREAGRMLHHQIQGTTMPKPKELRPFHVIKRASSEAISPNDPLVIEAITWLEKNLHTSNTLTELSQLCGVSPNTINRRFKSDLDKGPKKVLDELRIQRACNLLSDTELTIAEIAQLCGFVDSTPFGVSFRRNRHCTPSSYRAAFRTHTNISPTKLK